MLYFPRGDWTEAIFLNRDENELHLRRDALAERFELDDLQLFDGPPMKGVRTIVQTVVDIFGSAGAAFLVFDDLASEAVVREAAGDQKLKASYPLTGSQAVPRVRGTVKICDTQIRSDVDAGFASFGAGAVLGAPVLAPDGEVIGLLAVFTTGARLWTDKELERLKELANLIDQEIMLRASFATLGILARERIRLVN